LNVFAIGDLHLSGATPNKEMDVFGSGWEGHFDKISADWKQKVAENDVVLIPGDISWAMKLSDAQPDLCAIGALPGQKVLLRGNHDYWWDSLKKVRDAAPENCHILQNNCVVLGEYVFCGTRGWTLPQEKNFTEQDRKIYERELLRLKMSLDSAKPHADKQMIVLMHYPPIYEGQTDTGFTEIIRQYPAKEVCFGHLHGNILKQVNLTDALVGGARYNLVSADYLNFKLRQLC
jgi:predicted phosphohydrolase